VFKDNQIQQSVKSVFSNELTLGQRNSFYLQRQRRNLSFPEAIYLFKQKQTFFKGAGASVPDQGLPSYPGTASSMEHRSQVHFLLSVLVVVTAL
jgi:hypothetical protein